MQIANMKCSNRATAIATATTSTAAEPGTERKEKVTTRNERITMWRK